MEGSDAVIRLGLIGDNIAGSRAPELHETAGRMAGLEIRYERLVPQAMGRDFDAVFDYALENGFRGLNITYPYKERAFRRVEVDDPAIRRIGAVNTILFGDGAPKGFNTDYTGFMAAYRARYGAEKPRAVLLIGAGGAGRAVAFGLLALGAERIVVADVDLAKADALAGELRAASEGRAVILATNEATSAAGICTGIANCSPVGMTGHEGSPVPAECFSGKKWAFDAVYTPMDTVFRSHAEAADVPFLGGYELFFYQALHCFDIFTGAPVRDRQALREALAQAESA